MELMKMISMIFLLNCSSSPNAFDSQLEKHSVYLINRIDSVNDCYILYATRKDSTFEIISKKVKYQTACDGTVSMGRQTNPLHRHIVLCITPVLMSSLSVRGALYLLVIVILEVAAFPGLNKLGPCKWIE